MGAALAGAKRLAVRTNGTLSYLLGDHLGSSSVTANASGVKTASALYKAWGETRFSSGNLGTDYKFTGQREEVSFGLYFYNARWYDPAIGRFAQADSLIPQQNRGTQGMDRFAYVNNNPVRYQDPSGHRPCQNGNCQINPYQYQLENDFGWMVKGEGWSGKELQQVLLTGRAIKRYVDGITGGKGSVWMDKYMSNVSFWHAKDSPVYAGFGALGDRGHALPFDNIYLSPEDFSIQHIAHELAHVWDQRTAAFGYVGGVGDSLNFSLGGFSMFVPFFRWTNTTVMPKGIPWFADLRIPNDYLFSKSTNRGYGNGGPADYLAETFSWAIAGSPNAAPALAVSNLELIIQYEGGRLP